MPVLHDYYEIKRKYLKLNKFAIYDQFAKNVSIQKKYTFEEAIEIIREEIGKKWSKKLVNEFIAIIEQEEKLKKESE